MGDEEDDRGGKGMERETEPERWECEGWRELSGSGARHTGRAMTLPDPTDNDDTGDANIGDDDGSGRGSAGEGIVVLALRPLLVL